MNIKTNYLRYISVLFVVLYLYINCISFTYAQKQEDEVIPEDQIVTEGAVDSEDVVFWVNGSVSADGREEPIDDEVIILIYDKKTKDLFGTTELTTDGTFEFGGLSHGNYIVRVESEKYGSIYFKDSIEFNEATSIYLDEDHPVVSDVNITLREGVNAKYDSYLPSEGDIEELNKDEDEDEDKVNDDSSYDLLIYVLVGLCILFIPTGYYLWKKKIFKNKA